MLAYNLYVYCSNNPINMSDPSGDIAGTIGTLGGIGIGGIVGTLGVAATSLVNPQTKQIADQGYQTFNQFKAAYGSVQPGNQLHHIVEQNQIAKSGFSPQMIHNFKNIVEISMKAHYKISGYYNSVQTISEGMRFRDWLAGQSFNKQYEMGIKVIEMFKN